jgi:signal transduction histidine kinase
MAAPFQAFQSPREETPDAIPAIDAEAKWRQQAEELARSNLRLEEFAYTAAHDLREPLRAISLFTTLLVQEAQLDANARQIAGFIVDGVARMSILVEDLLSFARTGMLEPLRSVNLRHVVAQATQNLAPDIGADGAMVTVDRLPAVLGNEIQLIRLFQNLIGNAVKYHREVPVEIHITAVRRGPDWVVGIADNGLGIAPEDQARVFLPFIRLANRDVPGTGLGLAVCRNIVEALGGTIWVESALGAGSTFSFTIAAAD